MGRTHDRDRSVYGEMSTLICVCVVGDRVWLMVTFLRCKIVIGVYGTHMADSVYVPPSSRATVMEMFPSGTFIRDVEMAVGALDGVGYVAWCEAQ